MDATISSFGIDFEVMEKFVPLAKTSNIALEKCLSGLILQLAVDKNIPTAKNTSLMQNNNEICGLRLKSLQN